ncbi:MAG: MobB protein [Nostoc sp. DedQUE12b]|uniref:plasmid mobilization protein n=1 Tax=Nostoc sp. DedQUE12b TaxID=3075398 RepID=UPI002AD54296|nr:MobB protein [Nostoc sp. DedQUE12b]MDZ8084216.1 MobB protein [Nostoc sp. DedQUE12b]
MPLSPAVKQGMVSNSIKRTKSIKVYLFEKEKITIEEKAIATGVTASEYLRSCGLRRVLTAKPSADLITIRATAGTLKSELMMLSHLAKETNNQQILDTVNNAIALVDQTIAAAFNLDVLDKSPSSQDK